MNENISNETNVNWPYHGSKLIPKDDLKPFLKRNNINGIIHLFLHLFLIFISGLIIFLAPNIYIKVIAMIAHGTFIAFLYAGLHECVHKTAFINRKLNEIVGYTLGFIIFRSFLNGRYRHIAHHTFTQHPEKDPDKVKFPEKYSDYIKQVTGFVIWVRIIENLIRHSLGKINENEKEYIPSSDIKSLIRESRFMMLGYFIVILVSVYFSTTFFLIYWIIPRVLGEPFIRFVRMVEHTGREETADMIHNTRTSFPSLFLRFLYWNMPFHIEHHLYSNVPFHSLPEFHKLIKPHTDEMEPSIISVHIDILKQIWKNKKNNKKNNILNL
ncbi:MAG: fatty acid desaturase [Proteobacteria bacterium]|nr:fatty acid desaturase [Pseudomonadota bacterium]